MLLQLPDKPSIAILPFANLSGDASKDWIGDGLIESIISTLSVSPEMVVMGRGTAFAYKGKPVSPRDVAQDLGVRYVLTGSVQSSGDQMRVTAELSDAVAGKTLWSVREDGSTDELFEFQDQIARKLFVEMQVALTLGESSRTLFAMAGDFETITRLIEGRVEFQKFSPEGHQAAKRIWSDMLKGDPENPLGPYLMGYIAWQRVIIGISTDPAKDFAEARSLAQQSLALREFADPYSLMAVIDSYTRQYDAAIDMANRAIALSPGSADVNSASGFALYMSGAVEPGLAHMLTGMRLEPDYPEWLASAIFPALLEQGRIDEALSLARSVLAKNTKDLRARGAARSTSIVALVLSGDLEAAKAEAQIVLKAVPDTTADGLAASIFRGHKPRQFHDVYRDALLAAGLP